mgnify:CR=1 FL=1
MRQLIFTTLLSGECKVPNSKRWDRIYTNVNLVTLDGLDWGVVRDGALAVGEGQIRWVGRRKDLQSVSSVVEEDCGGRWMTPGLIDCHTHLIYGGNRVGEYEQRLNGESYEAIAKSGGGILSTVRATRDATEEELYESASRRLGHFIRDGVTTIEIKSGYGLDLEAELKMLRVARNLADRAPVDVVPTFLGAHALPPEYGDDRSGYVRLICEEMIPRVAQEKLACAVDCFNESIGFTGEETARIFDAAVENGLRVKLHADQLSDSSGAALAARYDALSADHVEYTSSDSVKAMARAGTVAVLLPGAYYALNETRRPPIEAFREYGVPMAVASDSNPGSSPVLSPRLMMNMACTLFALTPLEALQGMTVNAAQALGLNDRGRLAAGLRADLAIWDISEPAELAYLIGGQICHERICAQQL